MRLNNYHLRILFVFVLAAIIAAALLQKDRILGLLQEILLWFSPDNNVQLETALKVFLFLLADFILLSIIGYLLIFKVKMKK